MTGVFENVAIQRLNPEGLKEPLRVLGLSSRRHRSVRDKWLHFMGGKLRKKGHVRPDVSVIGQAEFSHAN